MSVHMSVQYFVLFYAKCFDDQVRDPTSAVANVDDYASSAKLLAATTLRNVANDQSEALD